MPRHEVSLQAHILWDAQNITCRDPNFENLIIIKFRYKKLTWTDIRRTDRQTRLNRFRKWVCVLLCTTNDVNYKNIHCFPYYWHNCFYTNYKIMQNRNWGIVYIADFDIGVINKICCMFLLKPIFFSSNSFAASFWKVTNVSNPGWAYAIFTFPWLTLSHSYFPGLTNA